MTKFLLFFALFTCCNLSAQLPDGTIAPDFVGYDLNGEEYRLYDILDSGKDVIIDFFFTSCVPCWNWHSSGTLEALYQEVGPEGTNEAVIMMVESYLSTDTDAIYGIGNSTTGDWTEGTSYPILENSNLAESYKINSFPRILKICKDRKIKDINAIRANGVSYGLEELNNCPNLDYAPNPFFTADKYDGCGSLEVQFEDQSWPRPESWFWDFGDGITSTEKAPLHKYNSQGEYTVTLSVSNAYGENQTSIPNLISVGENDYPFTYEVGGVKTDSGSFNEAHNKKLKFDAFEDLILETVKVYSNKEQERTIILLDETGIVTDTKIVNIPEGEHRIALNFFIPEGQDYQLGLCSERFLRIDAYSEYPYVIDDLISINGHSGFSSDEQYYYFYEWEVRPAACVLGASNSSLNLYELGLFPNPTSEMLNIVHANLEMQEIRVYDMMGKIQEIDSKVFMESSELDVSKLPSGIYCVEATVDGRQYISKFIKR